MPTLPSPAVRLSSLAILTLVGCASTAQFTTVRPAQFDAAPVRRVAVLALAGPEDSGKIASTTIAGKLAENGYYQLVDPELVARAAPASLYRPDGQADLAAAVEAGRRLGLDAVLTGRVRYRRDGGSSFGSVTFRVGDPTIAAEVEFVLLDARSGRTLLQDAVRQTHTGELTTDKTGPTSEQKIWARLVRDSAAQVAERIAPHTATVNAPLAIATFKRGATALNAGNKLAVQGDWTGAEERWRAALEANPQSDAALYNLGVAHEARQQYDRARELYAAAKAMNEQKLYGTALERVVRAGREQPIALAQLQRQPTTSTQLASRGAPPPRYPPPSAPGYLGPDPVAPLQPWPATVPASWSPPVAPVPGSPWGATSGPPSPERPALLRPLPPVEPD